MSELSDDNQFPYFPDGDVTICISQNTVLRLHSSILKSSCQFFARALGEKSAPGLKPSNAQKKDGFTPYRFVLVRNDKEGPGEEFQREDMPPNGLPPLTPGAIALATFNGTLLPDNLDPAVVQTWLRLFGMFYTISPELDGHPLSHILADCLELASAAQVLEAVECVRPKLESFFLSKGDFLWSSVASSPILWLLLSERLQCEVIFIDACVHAVGQWRTIADDIKAILPAPVLNLCTFKVEQLEKAKRAIDMRILGHYPAWMHRDATEKPGRTTYAGDVYIWMALCYFRQWFCQQYNNGDSRDAPDGGYQFYNLLAQGGTAYLTHEDFQDFYKYCPMSSKACNVLEGQMMRIKENVKHFVQELVKKKTHIDNEKGILIEGSTHVQPVDWLTCCIVEKSDCPWISGIGVYDYEALGEFGKSGQTYHGNMVIDPGLSNLNVPDPATGALQDENDQYAGYDTEALEEEIRKVHGQDADNMSVDTDGTEGQDDGVDSLAEEESTSSDEEYRDRHRRRKRTFRSQNENRPYHRQQRQPSKTRRDHRGQDHHRISSVRIHTNNLIKKGEHKPVILKSTSKLAPAASISNASTGLTSARRQIDGSIGNGSSQQQQMHRVTAKKPKY